MSRLAVHYYRPDFTEAQAKSLIFDLVEDLSFFEIVEVEAAIKTYRRDPASRFFPTSGQLRELCAEERKHRTRGSQGGDFRNLVPEYGEPRPIMWWMLPEQLWKPHWRETDIPIEYIAAFQKRRERKRANATMIHPTTKSV